MSRVRIAGKGCAAGVPGQLDERGKSAPAIDVFVDALDLAGLGFAGITPAAAGRPGCHSGLLLRLYV